MRGATERNERGPTAQIVPEAGAPSNARVGVFLFTSGGAPASIEERFWSRVRFSDGCWLWEGSRFPGGYGRFSPRHRDEVGAHRFSYSLAHGTIPPKMCIMHFCENRHCVKPSHLWMGTYSDRTRAAIAKGRFPGRRKTTRKEAA